MHASTWSPAFRVVVLACTVVVESAQQPKVSDFQTPFLNLIDPGSYVPVTLPVLMVAVVDFFSVGGAADNVKKQSQCLTCGFFDFEGWCRELLVCLGAGC